MKLSHEQELLVACARSEVDKESIKNIKNLARRTVGWGELVKSSIRHKVLPLVFQNLTLYCDDSFPEELRSQLEDGYIFENSLHNLELVEHLFFILELLEKKSIMAVPFKGPVLAENVFGDFTLRRFVDLDIFISSDDAEKAVDILLENGFVSEDGNLPEDDGRKKYLQKVVHVHLIHKKKNIPIDLQWDISNRFSNVPILLEDVKDRLELVSLNNKSVLSLPVEEQLCYLCIHGARHRWLYLDLVCCVSELIHARKDIDWLYVQTFAENMHCTTVLLLGLGLANELMGTEYPDYIIQKNHKDIKTKKLVEEVCDDLFSNYLENMVVPDTFDPFILRVKDRLVDKVSYVLRAVFIPTKVDLRLFVLPEALAFLRYLLRPMRLGGEYFRRRVFGRGSGGGRALWLW